MEIKKTPVNYISNKRMYALLKEYLANPDPDVDLPPELVMCFMRICERYAQRFNFARYSYNSEMILDGIEECLRRVRSFNPEKSENPFAYFTQVIKNAFKRRINEEQKEQYIKAKSLQQFHLAEQLVNNTYMPEENDVLNDFISRYEKRMAEKKKKEVKPKGLDAIFYD